METQNINVPTVKEIEKFIKMQRLTLNAGKTVASFIEEQETDEYKEASESFFSLLDMQGRTLEKYPAMQMYADALVSTRNNLN